MRKATGSQAIVGNALVIGGQGQVGRALAEILPQRGVPCTILARPDIDLLRPQSVADAIAVLRPGIVINAAAYTAVDKAEDEPELAHTINATAPGVIASAAALIGAPMIHLSTDYVFDGRQQQAYVETDPVAPLGVYGQTKRAGEQAVVAANAKHIILRTAWVCSPYGSNFVKTMLRLAAERPQLRVVDDQVGSPTFAHDLAEAIARIAIAVTSADALDHRFGLFHIASMGETTWCRFARAIVEGSVRRGGRDVPVIAIPTSEFPTKARRPAYSRLDTQKLATVYGISLPHWEEGLQPCLNALLGLEKAGKAEFIRRDA